MVATVTLMPISEDINTGGSSARIMVKDTVRAVRKVFEENENRFSIHLGHSQNSMDFGGKQPAWLQDSLLSFLVSRFGSVFHASGVYTEAIVSALQVAKTRW